ncbi:hypothetical protein ACFPM0_25485 [Pseudonocardia sulfidoxydans]|uniref:hypothetical protein n=1 Tax=Pseudonocardia sulfidoxydans TaxID=54011 RepID=UPI00360EB361
MSGSLRSTAKTAASTTPSRFWRRSIGRPWRPWPVIRGFGRSWIGALQCSSRRPTGTRRSSPPTRP